MAIAPLFIGPFAAGLTERDGNFSQICRGETRNKAERNERNILTLVTKCRFAPKYELIVTNNNNVETETTSDEFDLFDFNTEGFGTVVMLNGEKSVRKA